MRHQSLFLLAFTLAGGCARGTQAGVWRFPSPASEPLPTEARASFDQVIEAYRARGQFNGTVLVEKHGQVIYQRSAQVGEAPAGDAATRFRIGSVTKQFTATGILRLEEQGKLDVSDTVAKYWPDFPQGDRITLHMLLSHTSGLDDAWMDTDEFGRIVESLGSLERIVTLIEATAAPAQPGSRYRYANANYMLLGRLIEMLSGKSYDRFLADEVLRPAGLTGVGSATTHGPVPSGIAGYQWNESGEQLETPTSVQYGIAYSSGAVYASPAELCRWDRALQDDVVISAASRARAQTPVLDGYGYGWGIHDIGGHRVVQHGGSIEGFRTFFMRLVDDGVCVVVAANVEPASDYDVATALAHVYLGMPATLPSAPITLPPEELDRLAGRYRTPSGRSIVLTREGDTLRYSQGLDLRNIKLVFDGRDTAYFRQVDGSVRFRDARRARSLEVTLFGDRFTALRE